MPEQQNVEAALSAVHADLVARMQQDERLRAVEQQVAALGSLPSELVRVEERIMRGLGDVKGEITRVDAEHQPQRVSWPAVLSSIVAAIVLLLIVAERLYA